MEHNSNRRFETEAEVKEYIKKMSFALEHGAYIRYIPIRKKDANREIRFTNGYAMNDLFPDENPVLVLKRELRSLDHRDYIGTLKDDTYPDLDDFREFAKKYNDKYVYIKIRVELVTLSGGNEILVMSFHYAEFEIKEEDFLYKQ